MICESCVTSNTKKMLKDEHTKRLKAAFVQSLQHEQDLEEHVATQLIQQASSGRESSPDVSGTNVLPPSLDFTVQPSMATVRSIISAHRRSPSSMKTLTNSATIERGHFYQHQLKDLPTYNSRSGKASAMKRHLSSNMPRMDRSRKASLIPSLNNYETLTKDLSNRDKNSDSENSVTDSETLMGGPDPASMAQFFSATQQQMIMDTFGAREGSGGTNTVSTSSSISSESNASNYATAAAFISQFAAMSKHLMNPLLCNYQALVLARAMQAARLTSLSSTTSSSYTNETFGNSSESDKTTSLSYQNIQFDDGDSASSYHHRTTSISTTHQNV